MKNCKSNPDIIIDGAHNPEGIESLVKTVEAHYKDKNVIVLFTALGDKQLHNMVGQLETIADEIILQHSPLIVLFLPISLHHIHRKNQN